MKSQIMVGLVALLLPLMGQAQGDFYGTLYLDNELPELVIEDRRHNMAPIRVKTANVQAYSLDNRAIPVEWLENGDPVSYKYNSYTQRLKLWVDLVALERIED
ncbi:hypothetical protein [Aestuariirhabdus litorea]|uniref:Uncharacterized protein n=1 Tax=Aestuariirhabdus litorea TaxID=2528527 RepID=A0A3P3VLP8_9GAMM|nr:hypothetical protein [Aestuariirhabdus litorea]RRJ83257.1 hypothetical protein D0544_15630 [Aestuariirhabdus litorea]RWW93416.1 hypothetical protein DZC74_15600 [Endozoicomonadaceae bacterium GTF-13]